MEKLLTIPTVILIIILVFAVNHFAYKAQDQEYNLNSAVVYQLNYPVKIIYGLIEGELLYEIIKCESDFDPSCCNRQYGCGSGMGLAQIIPRTLKHCEEKLKRSLDPFDPYDNIACANWLLENEGSQHWGTKDTDWGSYYCWSDKIK